MGMSDNKLSAISATLLIITSMLGYGIICAPNATAQVGYLNALVLIAGVSFITFSSISLIFKSCDKLKQTHGKTNISYFELLSSIHPIAGNFANLLVFFIGFTSNIAYILALVEWGCNIVGLTGRKNVFLVSASFSIIQFFLSFIRDLKFLQKASYLSLFSCLLVAMTIVIYLIKLRPVVEVKSVDTKIENCLGKFIFAMCCQSMIPVVYSSLRSNVKPTNVALMVSIGGGLMVVFFGIGGYFLCGNEMQSSQKNDILGYMGEKGTIFRHALETSFDKKGMLIKICQVFFVLLLNCSYIFQMFPARAALISLIKIKFSNKTSKSDFLLTTIVSFLYIALACCLSSYKAANKVVSYSGTYLINVIAFIFPSISYFSIVGMKTSTIYNFMAIINILVGISLMVIMTILDLKK